MATLHFTAFPPKGVVPFAVQYQKLQPDMYARLYAGFKREMLAALKKPEDERTFQRGAESSISDKPIVWEFRWAKSGTSARVIWARPTGEGQKPDLQATTVFFTRMDANEENAFLDRMKANENLTMVDPASYEAVRNDPGPVAATFYANEEAMRDSLIHALITMTAAAFFDQFGMANPEHVVRMKVKGMIFLPEGMNAQFQPMELFLPDAEEQELFRQFLTSVKNETGFVMTMNVTGDDRPITIRFSHIGRTAAFFMLTYDVNDDPKHIHELTALLPKLDRDEDRQAISHVRKYAALRAIKPESFDLALDGDDPVVATFFADIGSANYPPLQTIIRLLSLAFFSQFGIGTETE